MITHFIILSSSYFLGTRIAMDFIVPKDETEEIKEQLQELVEKITKECGRDVSISTHVVQAQSKAWESLCEADHYFKDVKVISKADEFIELIKKDRNLEGTDVAKYILSKIKCTQLKLQKLVYLCFADYLIKTKKELYTDKIYALQYGPVVDSVYKKYKKYGYKPIEEDTQDIESDVSNMPALSRILVAEDGVEKMDSIETTLKKYGDLSASELVSITHRNDSPWSKTYRDSRKCEIKRKTIMEYHEVEEL